MDSGKEPHCGTRYGDVAMGLPTERFPRPPTPPPGCRLTQRCSEDESRADTRNSHVSFPPDPPGQHLGPITERVRIVDPKRWTERSPNSPLPESKDSSTPLSLERQEVLISCVDSFQIASMAIHDEQ